MNWDDIDWSLVNSMELTCQHCKHINIILKGEDLSCEACGEDIKER